jgi:hypothetical protein
MLALKLSAAALLLSLASPAAAHGNSGHGSMDMGGMQNSTNSTFNPLYEGQYSLPSYAGLDSYTGSLLAHIVLEVMAWFFVLPIGSLLQVHADICVLTLPQASCSALPDRARPSLSSSSSSS